MVDVCVFSGSALRRRAVENTDVVAFDLIVDGSKGNAWLYLGDVITSSKWRDKDETGDVSIQRSMLKSISGWRMELHVDDT